MGLYTSNLDLCIMFIANPLTQVYAYGSKRVFAYIWDGVQLNWASVATN